MTIQSASTIPYSTGRACLFLALGYLLLCGAVSAGATFQRVSTVDHADYLHGVVEASDGGVVTVGSTRGPDVTTPTVMYVEKLDEFGRSLWAWTFGSSEAGSEAAYSVIESSDGNYVVAGKTAQGPGPGAVSLLKIAPAGNVLWAKAIGGSGVDEATAVIETADGHYVVAGRTYSNGAGKADFYVVKTTADGELVWTRTVGGAEVDVAESVIEAANGDLVVAGWTQSYGHQPSGLSAMYLVVLEPTNGGVTLARAYGGDVHDGALGVVQDVDGNYVMAGVVNAAVIGFDDVLVVKVEQGGLPLWGRAYGRSFGREHASSLVHVIEDVDGVPTSFFVSGGSTDRIANNIRDQFIQKLDADGGVVWQNEYGGDHSKDYGLGLAVTGDGGYVSVGASHSWDAELGEFPPDGYVDDEFYTVRTDALGDSGCHQRPLDWTEEDVQIRWEEGGDVSQGGTVANVVIEPVTQNPPETTVCSNAPLDCPEQGRGVTQVSVLGLPIDTWWASNGFSVDVSEDQAVAGAPWLQFAQVPKFRGQANLYEQDLLTDEWQLHTVLETAEVGLDTGDSFGESVAISGDFLAVGSSERRTVWLFEWDGSSWIEVDSVAPSTGQLTDEYGWSVALDDTRLAVGAPYWDGGGVGELQRGRVHVYERDALGAWLESSTPLEGNSAAASHFGWSVSLSGDSLLVGAPGDGPAGAPAEARMFEHDGVDWQFVGTPWTSGDDEYYYGLSVAVSGDLALVGEPAAVWPWPGLASVAGLVYTFEHQPGGWVEGAPITSGEVGSLFGFSVSLAGRRAAIAEPLLSATSGLAGAVQIYDRRNEGWDRVNELKPPATVFMDTSPYSVDETLPNAFGNAVAVGPAGDVVVGHAFGVADFGFMGTVYICSE